MAVVSGALALLLSQFLSSGLTVMLTGTLGSLLGAWLVKPEGELQA